MISLSALEEAFPIFAGIPAEALFGLIVALALWTTAIKAYALWHAARNGQLAWFVALMVVNTAGILELVYLLAFRKEKPAAVAQEAVSA